MNVLVINSSINHVYFSYVQKILDFKSSLTSQLVDGLKPVVTVLPAFAPLDATYHHDPPPLVNATKPFDVSRHVNATNNHNFPIPLNATNHLDASGHVNDTNDDDDTQNKNATNDDDDTQNKNATNYQDVPIPVNDTNHTDALNAIQSLDVSVSKEFQEEANEAHDDGTLGLNSDSGNSSNSLSNINNSSAPRLEAVQVDFIHPPGSRPSLQPAEETPEDLEDGEEDELTILSSPEDEDELDPPISMKTGRFRSVLSL